jgi:hypothetical protein
MTRVHKHISKGRPCYSRDLPDRAGDRDSLAVVRGLVLNGGGSEASDLGLVLTLTRSASSGKLASTAIA